MKCGYIGLGNMGGALARRIISEHELRVYDLRPETMDRFADLGAIPTQSPKALASECDTVMTCLPTSADVREVIFGDDGLAAGLAEASVIADMTTGDPVATRAMAAELEARGIHLIDAPVSGGPHGAEAGTIAIMVGGSKEIFDRIHPVFASISPNIFHTGDVGTGHTMKLVNNVIAAGVRAITFEALTMGIKNGLGLESCVEVLHKGSARSYTTETTLPKLLKGPFETSFALGLMHKDVRLAAQLGIDSGVPMFLANMVREMFQEALNDHGPDEDVNTLIHCFERKAKTKVVQNR
jgi:3-hydroxyisobutyrate dehydrogenase